jgi:hydrogenase small subunit
MNTANTVSRRSFLQLSARLSVLMGLGASAVPRVAEALEELAQGSAPVLWLQGQCCTGCSVSLLNAEPLTPLKLLTKYISLGFHQTLASATGHQAVDTVNRMIAQGGYVLIVEGSVPAKMPRACMFGEEPFSTQLSRAARNAKAILALGSCAAFGGIPAAENNPTGATSVPAFLKSQGINPATILIPGCPSHPDWLVGTVVHLLKFGLPPLDALGRPKEYFSRSMHDQCPRFADYERERFARTFGEEGCLFKLGCLGPITKTDCNIRPWNGGKGSCIRSGAPCIGCGGEEFAAKTDFPFLTKNRPATEKRIGSQTKQG